MRKTAAMCICKLYDVSPTLVEEQGFIESLHDMISDENSAVVANAIAALCEIQDNSPREVLKISTSMLQKLMVALTECTELGTVYTPEELKAICDYAHAHGMVVHMDGARLSNAVAYLGCPPRALTTDAGIDVLSFGGTKNGMMFGEAVVFFNTSTIAEVPFIRKQAMQLHSKTRFIAAQFSTVLKDGLWLKAAAHANRMAQMLANEAENIPGVRITQEVQGNEIFAIIPRDKIKALQEKCFFYVWDENASEVRWVCSFDTTESDIIEFVNILRQELC